MPERPGGELATRDLHFFWLLDGSTSMEGAKVQSLNFAVANAIPGMQAAAASNPQVRLLIHALRFATDVWWIAADGQQSTTAMPPISIAAFDWRDFVTAGGETAMGRALSLVADELGKLDMAGRYFPPVIVLVTDGGATDDFDAGLDRLMAHPFGKNAVRVAVAIQDGDSQVDIERLQRFIGRPEIPPLLAHNSDEVAAMIAFCSTTAIERSSRPAALSRSRLTPSDDASVITDLRK